MRRNVCENCGAPLRKTGIRGKFVCDYCHAEYYDDSYTDDPVPDIVEQPIVIPANPKKKKLPNLIILAGILGFAIFACLVSPILFSNSAQNSMNSQLRTKISTPIMLNTLPEAVKAGTPVAYRGMEILLSPELTVENQAIYFKLTVQNWENQTTIFRYRPNQLILYDNLGNRYNLALKNCELDIPFQDRQITFKPGEQIDFESASYWCSHEDTLPAFSGVIPIEAKNLYLKLENFGVFQNITFIIEL